MKLNLLVKSQNWLGLCKFEVEGNISIWTDYGQFGQLDRNNAMRNGGTNEVKRYLIEDIQFSLRFQFEVIWTRIGGVIKV